MFDCHYCATQHQDEAHAEEHIIPKALLNERFTLDQTCRRWNNYFARAFETAVVSSGFVEEVLRVFEPARAPSGRDIYLGEVQTARNTTEHRWLRDGQEMLRDMPTRSTTRKYLLPVFDKEGKEESVEITLPFELAVNAKGSLEELAKVEARLRVQVERLVAYIAELAKDPSIDPVFAREIATRGLIVRPPLSATVAIDRRAAGAPRIVDDLLPRRYPVEIETWAKFYMKIAWCAACKAVGSDALRRHGGGEILRLLQNSHVDADLVVDCRAWSSDVANTLFRDAVIDAETVWFWRTDLDSSEAMLQRVSDDALRLRLSQAFSRRREYAARARQWVFEINPGNLTVAADDEQILTSRFHRIRLWPHEADGRKALVCEVEIFGGIMGAVVQVTPAVTSSAYPQELAIEQTVTIPF